MRKIAERKFNLASILLMLFSVTFCALTVLAADEKTVRIVVDNQEKNFIKTPILTDDQAILVSLEDFAKAVNATVLWDGDGKSFVIGYGNTAYMTMTGEKTAFAAQNYDYKEWETIPLEYPALFSEKDEQILISAQEVCAALGIENRFDTASGTLYLTCKEDIEDKMTVGKMRNMDLVYYANEKGESRFDIDSEDLLEFYNQRRIYLDAFVMGISDIWSGAYDIFSSQTNAEIGITDSLKALMTALPDNEIIEIESDFLTVFKNGVDSTKTVVDNIRGLKDDILEIKPELIPLKKSLSSFESGFGDLSLIYDVGAYSADMLAIFLSNYAENIDYLDVLEEALYESGDSDETLISCISFLKVEYTNKAFQALNYSRDKLVEFCASTSADVLTGGIFKVGTFAWDSLVSVTKVKEKGEALKQFYGLFCLNGSIDRAYKNYCRKVLSGEADGDDLKKFKKLDDLQRALKATAYESIRIVTNDRDTKDYCKIKENEYAVGCMRWNEVLTAAETQNEQAENVPSESSDSIYALYEPLVRQCVDEYGKRHFICWDIDKDGVKELIIDNYENSDSASLTTVLDVRDQELVKMGTGTLSEWMVTADGKVLINACADSGCIYNISNGFLQLEEEYYWSAEKDCYMIGYKFIKNITSHIEKTYGATESIILNVYDTEEEALEALYKELYLSDETAGDEFQRADIGQLPETFRFTSGAGAWLTELYLNKDGTFSGKYLDSDSGEQPTEVFCNFEGNFSDLKPVDEYVSSMSLESLDTVNTPGEEYFRDGTKYISSTPYGLENTQEVYVYFPGCPTSSIPKEIADWVTMSYGIDVTDRAPGRVLYTLR